MKNFNEIYKSIYDKYNNQMEKIRKKALLNNLFIILLAVLIAVITLFVFPSIFPIIIFPIVILLLILFMFNPSKKNFEKKYKKTIISELITGYDKNLNFNPDLNIPKKTYNDAEFESYDEYSANDYIFGKINGIIDFELGDVHTMHISHDSEGHTTKTTVFQGLFSCSKLNKNINSTIKIRSDKGFFGKFFKDKQLMHMDSQEFEKHFDVLTDSKIKAMQVLTSDIMDYLINFKSNNKITFEITIKNQSFYIRIHCNDMFEGSIFINALDYNRLQKYYNFLDFMCTLNTKIYTILNEKNL